MLCGLNRIILSFALLYSSGYEKTSFILTWSANYFFIAVVDKYAGAAIAFVTGSKAGMVVGIIIAIVIVIIIVLCIRQAFKGLKEAKEKALLKLEALIKREENVELPDAAPDMELSAVQPASANKKKLVRDVDCKVCRNNPFSIFFEGIVFREKKKLLKSHNLNL